MTTTTAPEMTPALRHYVETVYAYNSAVSDLNTSFGGMNLQPSLFDKGDKILATLEDAVEFIQKREEQIAHIRELSDTIAAYITSGVDAQYRRYQTDAHIHRIQNSK